jgi:ASC-1-like (ASCH) protein
MIRKTIQQPYFNFIRSGLKTKEGRAIEGFWTEDAIGKIIEIEPGPNDNSTLFRLRIKGVRIYRVSPEEVPSHMEPIEVAIRKMLLNEGVNSMLPDISNFEEGVRRYLGFNRNNLKNSQIGAFTFEIIRD